MSNFPTIAAGEIDRSSPLTGAVLSAPAWDSVMEKLRERDDYLHEVILDATTPSTHTGLSADEINPDAIATYDGTPVGGDGIRIFGQLKREVDVVLEHSFLGQFTSAPPNNNNASVVVTAAAPPWGLVLFGMQNADMSTAASRVITQKTKYTNAGIRIDWRMSGTLPDDDYWFFDTSATLWSV